MFVWNTVFFLAILALCLRVLPWNEWLSAAVISLGVALAGIAFQISAVDIVNGAEMGIRERTFWILFIIGTAVCLKGIAGDLWRKLRGQAT